MPKLLLLSLLLLPSCSVFGKLQETIQNTRDLVSTVKTTFDELRPTLTEASKDVKEAISDGKVLLGKTAGLSEIVTKTAADLKEVNSEAFKKADKNEDGELSWAERLAYVLALGGGAAEILRRRMKETKNKFENLETRVTHERVRRKQIEALVVPAAVASAVPGVAAQAPLSQPPRMPQTVSQPEI